MKFDIADFLSALIIHMVVWIFSVSAHEFGHAWVSYKFGDDTAYRLGRVTLNPIPHIDPIGTLVLPIIGFIASYGGSSIALIAWGKPTPVNPLKWRNKDVANVCVSIAGIVINLTIAIIAATLLKTLSAQGVLSIAGLRDATFAGIAARFLITLLLLNVGLAIFNLLPFPPLDGSKVLQTFLPRSFEPYFELLERFGFLILLVLVQVGIIGYIMDPIFLFVVRLLMS